MSDMNEEWVKVQVIVAIPTFRMLLCFSHTWKVVGNGWPHAQGSKDPARNDLGFLAFRHTAHSRFLPFEGLQGRETHVVRLGCWSTEVFKTLVSVDSTH